MKKRFSSLNIKDIAAWLLAGATFACLASAGAVIGRRQKIGARDTVCPGPNLTPET